MSSAADGAGAGADIVSLREVRLSLGTYEALRGVSVGFAEGKSTVIVGPSGCGKSTLLKVAAGLIPADSGKVLYRERPLLDLPEREMLEFRRHSGFVFQDGALWENKSLMENLTLPLLVADPVLPRSEADRRAVRALERVGLEDSTLERPAALSGGERKVASFMRALMTEPSLLFLDEPTLSIDHAMSERVHQMIREQKQRGGTIIAVTHDAALTAMLADRLVVMDAGQVIAAGDFDEVKRTQDARARAILSQVLSEIASYDTDLLDLLDRGGKA
jgi:phospholipid/cholesterol/gamma-HCH transport system ATP-binding protein